MCKQLSLSFLVILALTRPSLVFASTLYVPSQYPSIHMAMNAAVSGDTVEVACGIYVHSGADIVSGVCLRSETGEPDCVTLNQQPGAYLFTCIGVDETTVIEGLTITGADWFAALLCFDGSYPTIRNCVFADNVTDRDEQGGAITCFDSAPTLIDCVFKENGARHFGAGLFCRNSALTLLRCSFINNYVSLGGISVYCEDGSLSMDNCTHCFEMHGASAILVTGSCHADITNGIIAFGTLYSSTVIYEGSASATLACCDFYGNEGGDWVGCIADQYGINGNISEDPLFCDPGIWDFTIQACSPCRPSSPPNPECDLIGAWPVGCGGTPVQSASWGQIKALFRNPK